jgi:hypothetical protein
MAVYFVPLASMRLAFALFGKIGKLFNFILARVHKMLVMFAAKNWHTNIAKIHCYTRVLLRVKIIVLETGPTVEPEKTGTSASTGLLSAFDRMCR